MQKNVKFTKSNESSQPIHIRLENPLDLRKKILSAAITSSKMLQAYSQLQEIQDHRKAVLNSLDSKLKEINALTKKFRQQIPAIRYKEDLPKIRVEEVKIVSAPKIIKEIPATNTRDSEVDQLKKELADIEHKLKYY